LDSLSKSYPIGNLIFYKSDDVSENNIFGRCDINKTTNDFKYILDGNKRLISLFNTIYNLKDIQKYHFYEDVFEMYYDLENEIFTHSNEKSNILLVPTNILLDIFCIIDYESKLKTL